MTRHQRVSALVLPHLVSAAVAGLVTVAGAIALSAVFPIGALRIAEPHPGIEVHVTGLAVGAAGAALVTLLLAGLVAWYRTGPAAAARERRPLRASVLVARLTHLGAEPAAVVGARMATEPGRGRTAVPVRATLVGVTATVVGLVAIATFQHSVVRTTTVPARFGVARRLHGRGGTGRSGRDGGRPRGLAGDHGRRRPAQHEPCARRHLHLRLRHRDSARRVPSSAPRGRAPDRAGRAGGRTQPPPPARPGDRGPGDGGRGRRRDPLDFLLVGTTLAPTSRATTTPARCG